MTGNLMEVRGLTKRFAAPSCPFPPPRHMHAVNGVSFDLARGRTVGVVGESGCGKSTLARLVLRLIEPSGGAITFEGSDLLATPAGEMRRLRARMQMVFQDPYSAIDPRYTVARAVAEPFVVQGRRPAPGEVDALLAMVGLNPGLADSFPHQISGGQKQRVGIARALALRPSLLVLDEPTASLDVSVQAQIVSLLEDLRAELGLTYLFISHDLGLVRHFCDAILVMYLGRVVEALPDTGRAPRHPYTRALLDSTFAPDPARRRVIAPLEGEVPSPFDLPPGCAFAGRCPQATALCREAIPDLAPRGGHPVACHHPL